MVAALFIYLISVFPPAPSVQPDHTSSEAELEVIVHELDMALESFFFLLDEQDLEVFMNGVRHASRARLLLEQYIGEDIDDLSGTPVTIEIVLG